MHANKTYNMQLSINGERPISEVQKDFNTAYPFLKLEFFRNGRTRQSRYPAHQKIDQQMKVKDAWGWKKDSGQLKVEDQMTVHELEKAFLDEFGLSVQVFRKSGNIWLETTMTDHWTLKQQSDHGREISTGTQPGRTYGDLDLERDSD